MKLEDIRVEGSEYEISLVKLVGKQIKDICGNICQEYDDPVFHITKVEFEDNTFLGCKGEHDFPYLVSWGKVEQPNFDEDTFYGLLEQDEDE